MTVEAQLSWMLAAFAALILCAGWLVEAPLRVVARLRARRPVDPSRATPYRATEAPSVDPLRDDNRRLRRALAVTRLAAVAPLVALGAWAWTLGDRAPATAAPSWTATRPAYGWPFDRAQNPVARVGQTFDYAAGAGGYQVGMRFDTSSDVRLVGASLDLTARVRVIPGQTERTEGIWVDGVLSGTTWRGFRAPGMTVEDLSGRNTFFTRAVFACCRERVGRVSIPLADLLLGSMRTPEAVLARGALDVVIADDVEVLAASLTVCAEGGRCRAIAPQPVTSVAARAPASP